MPKVPLIPESWGSRNVKHLLKDWQAVSGANLREAMWSTTSEVIRMEPDKTFETSVSPKPAPSAGHGATGLNVDPAKF